jgi:hypothetical protein
MDESADVIRKLSEVGKVLHESNIGKCAGSFLKTCFDLWPSFRKAFSVSVKDPLTHQTMPHSAKTFTPEDFP